MAEIGRIAGSSLKIEDVFEQLSLEAARFIQFDRMVIALINEGEEVFPAIT